MNNSLKGLTRTQLKIIAILAMVCDHAAWGFLDFFTPGALFLHVVGRLTLPIMCFFVAEGFQKTSNIKRYVSRMLAFWLVSAIPFYLFFHKWYGYRQNIIFDLLLGLFALLILEHKTLKKSLKICLMVVIFAVSMLVGGWVVLPILYILIFYYKKTFAARAKWFCGVTVLLVVFLMIANSMNQNFHFSHYNWTWYEQLYFLGFMLALPLLRRYNGEKGGGKKMNYFFYFFYPFHFCALWLLKILAGTPDIYYVYLGMNVFVLILAFVMMYMVSLSRPSRAQSTNLVFISFSIIYMFGFILEVTGSSLDTIYAAIKVEYFGECLLTIALTRFVAEFFRVRIPVFVYIAEIIVSLLTMFCMFTLGKNDLFYTKVSIDYSGLFTKVALSYGVGFYLFIAYLGIICLSGVILGINAIRKSKGVEQVRNKYMMLGFFCPWVANIIRATGVTGGYEVTFLGILGISILVTFSWIKYGYFDSITLAGENALKHGKEGVMVVSTNHHILYYNQIIKELFSDITINQNAYKVENLKKVFEGAIKTMEVNHRIYEMRIEPLMEYGYLQAYMLWTIDMTQHYNVLKKMEVIAKTDDLTGLPTRNHFQQCFLEHIKSGGSGSMFMIDIDNFKTVNDTFGHGTGDLVLIGLGNIIKKYGLPSHFYCRIGGDEFCMFFNSITDAFRLSDIADSMISDFKLMVEEMKLDEDTNLSIGIAVFTPSEDKIEECFDKLCNKADKALYLAKNSGKGIYRFY